MKKQVAVGDLVQAHLVGRKENGDEFVSTKDRPLSFIAGNDDIFPIVSRGIFGMSRGESRVFSLEAKDAYGEIDPRKVVRLDKIDLPEGLKVGAILGTDDDNDLEFIVEKVESNYAIVNGNHPLAGERITVEVQIVSVNASPRPSTDICQ